jgi:hypothetical protein
MLIYRMFATLLSRTVMRTRFNSAKEIKEIEILVVRHQLVVLQRRMPRRG